MRRLDDFTQQKNRQIGIQYFDLYFCTRENFLVQIFWPLILKLSLAFRVNANLTSDPGLSQSRSLEATLAFVQIHFRLF